MEESLSCWVAEVGCDAAQWWSSVSHVPLPEPTEFSDSSPSRIPQSFCRSVFAEVENETTKPVRS